MANKGKYVYEWPRPMVTADTAVFAFVDGTVKLLLVQRKFPPYQDQWALPGGFIEMDEDLPDAAARELAEETGLQNIRLEQLGTFGGPGRDPRGRTITVVYTGIVEAGWDLARADDDAAHVAWFEVEKLPPMAFDHKQIAQCAIQKLKGTKEYRSRAETQEGRPA